MRVLSFFALLAPLAAAISITSPAANSTVTKGSTYDLTWTTVDTDPETFSIYLVNFVNWPPSVEPLALNLETAAGDAKVRIPCDVDDSYGFQFNAINGTNTYVIYAQSPKFSIGGADCTDPPSTSTCAAATVTVTVSGTSVTPAPHQHPRSYGNCPDTIGWSSGYSHPVTLSSVPHGGQAKITAPSTPEPSNVVVVKQTVYVSMEECGCMAN